MAERRAERHRFQGKSGSLRLWAPWLTGPLAWAAHQNLTYWLSSWMCGSENQGLFLLVTVALLALPAVGALLGWRAWRTPLPGDARGDRVRFLALVGTMVCGAAILGILIETIPVFVLDPCGGIP